MTGEGDRSVLSAATIDTVLVDDPTLDTEFYMVGYVSVHIVGTRYYRGSSTLRGRQLVFLVREILNRFDENAIKVVNIRDFQIGYIERQAASILAPLMDANQIKVEAIVPPPHPPVRYSIPCQVHIFARLEVHDDVKEVFMGSALQLLSQPNPSFGLSASAIVREKASHIKAKSVDEIFKLVDEKANRGGAIQAMEPPKNVIITELFQHQKEALGWLVHRENSTDLPPFWEEKDGECFHMLTNYLSSWRPEPLHGGIFGDDMGLGKTLTLLSLIALDKYVNPDENEQAAEKVEVISSTSDVNRCKRKGRPGKQIGNLKKKCKLSVSHESFDVQESKPTLIVCPPSVFSTWITELEEHTRPGSLKTYFYYRNRTRIPEELEKYDIVLTTYSTLGCELFRSVSPVGKVKWWRIILDEAHIIKNESSQQTKAVLALNAKNRWIVTGTPIQNSSFDLYAFMAFLRFEPFATKCYWRRLIQRPLDNGEEKALHRIQVLMGTISLRRMKDRGLVGLPSKTIEIRWIELSAKEREIYDHMVRKAKNVIRQYISLGTVIQNYSAVLSIILRLRQICANVALCPSDYKIPFSPDQVEDINKSPELLKKMVSFLQDGEDFDCPICMTPPSDLVITCCAHIFCRGCILKALKCSKPCCPLCRLPLRESDLFSAPIPSEIITPPSGSIPCSKINTLLELLSESRDQNPTTKSIVFSQFRKILLLLEGPLKANGFKILRLDATLNAKKRNQVIKRFGDPKNDGPTVLLATLKSSGAGINLTVASRVYLMEPWWNSALEEQAMDRVHRIGQKEDVKIVRLIAKNSIEERILELQERKKRLAADANENRALVDRREVSLDDLRALVSL